MSRAQLARKVGRRPVKKTIVVVCEGGKSEPQYIGALAQEAEVFEHAAVDLQIDGTGGEVPLTLVRRAVDLATRDPKEHGEIDEVWCLFDVEWPRNHPNLPQALALARANGIKLAISNPCFELWLILHFQDSSAWLDNTQARRTRRSCDGQPGKSLDPALYMPTRHAASARAVRLEQMHESAQRRFPNNNPSSGMFRLIASAEGR